MRPSAVTAKGWEPVPVKILVDAASMFIVKDPKRFQVVVASNLFGDIPISPNDPHQWDLL